MDDLTITIIITCRTATTDRVQEQIDLTHIPVFLPTEVFIVRDKLFSLKELSIVSDKENKDGSIRDNYKTLFICVMPITRKLIR